jgi:hypothetical protein
MFKGTSWIGGDSEGGTGSMGSDADGSDADGSDACGSLAAVYIESRGYTVAKLLPRGRISLVAAHDLLGWGLGCKENG